MTFLFRFLEGGSFSTYAIETLQSSPRLEKNHTRGPADHVDLRPVANLSRFCVSRNVLMGKAVCILIACQSLSELPDFASNTRNGNRSSSPF